jgi:hypothetical protein
MKRVIRSVVAGLGVAGAYFVLSALPALANESGTVDAKVTVSSPCITVGPAAAVDFGVLGLGSKFAEASPKPTYANCSAATETIWARATDATSTTSSANWTLTFPTPTCNAGDDAPNQYQLQLGPMVGQGIILEKTSKTFASNVSAGASSPIHFFMYTPCSGSAGAGETMTMQLILTATF